MGPGAGFWRFAICALAGLAVLVIDAESASAQTCLDRVLALARHHGIAIDPPTVPPGGNPDLTTRDLARSGGVIEPAPVPDHSVIAPPPGLRSHMPTLPDIGVPDRAALQAILVAARAQAERGNETGCRKTLARTHGVIGGSG